MKILSAEQIRAADKFTIETEPISSTDLMERASKKFTEKLLEIYPENSVFHVFCGVGNNGGDGLVAARLLHGLHKEVHLYVVRFCNSCSTDFELNFERLSKLDIPIVEVESSEEIQPITEGVIVDAILGTGVSRKVDSLIKEVCGIINSCGIPVVSIDLPSGLFAQNNTPDNMQVAIKATYTITFQVPKLCFLLESSAQNIGRWYVIDIGLSKVFLAEVHSTYSTFDFQDAVSMLKRRGEHTHKGSYGHAFLALGSFGKIGAAVLSAMACLRSGVGLLTCYVPRCGYEVLQEKIPEAMVLSSPNENYLAGLPDINPFNAIGVGPGIGQSEAIHEFISGLITSLTSPSVFDADALNIMSTNKSLLGSIPKSSILTPHPKEFERLFGPSISDEERLQLQVKMSIECQLIIVLKGHHTSISLPNGNTHFNTSGNAGMATAGSGDVLTGIITSLLAQGYLPYEAACLGVYIHGLAGDICAQELGQEAMIASDIINALPQAFKAIHACQEE